LHAGASYNAAIAELNLKYIAAVDRAMQTARAEEKLDEAVALRDEPQRAKDGQPLPATDARSD